MDVNEIKKDTNVIDHINHFRATKCIFKHNNDEYEFIFNNWIHLLNFVKRTEILKNIKFSYDTNNETFIFTAQNTNKGNIYTYDDEFNKKLEKAKKNKNINSICIIPKEDVPPYYIYWSIITFEKFTKIYDCSEYGLVVGETILILAPKNRIQAVEQFIQ